MPPSAFKIVLLGEGRVGKTSLISRYVNDTFNEQERSTVQATMFSTKTIHLDPTNSGGPARNVVVALWDTAGQERFHALAPIYYRNADGAMLVYDVNDADTLLKVRTWVRELRAVAGDRIRLVLCGNKADLPESERDVTVEAATTLADELGAAHFFTSAKTGSNVVEAFTAMAATVADAADATAGGVSSGGSSSGAVGGAALSSSSAVGAPKGRRRRAGVQIAEDDVVGEEDGMGYTPSRPEAPSGRRLYDDGFSQSPQQRGAAAAPSPPRRGRPVTLEELNNRTPNDNAVPKSGWCCG